MKRFIVILVAGVLVFAVQANATIINVPADQPNIQAGIDASSHGDTVRVASGTYVENIDFSGKNIVVGSWFLDAGDTSYISSTIIDGGASGLVVTFENGEDNTAVITGFTIQNGFASDGGGIFCRDSSPAITNNIISENSAILGGGILCVCSSPAVSNNTIIGNSATQYGGGIFCASSSPTITNNTISGNSAGDKGGGIYCWDYSSPPITNTIFWADSAPSDHEIYLCGTSSPVITYCDIQGGWTGEGNINADPLFHDPDNDDFHLKAIVCGDPEDSPCLGTGFENADIGAFGIWCEIPFCVYIPGDCNHNGTALELGDVIAMIGMYRGSVVPPYECSCPPHGDNFTPTADPNGNCVAFELGDVVTEIGAYRGSTEAVGCEDCPGSIRLFPGNEESLPAIPRLKLKMKIGKSSVSE